MGGLTDPPWQAVEAGDIESKRSTARGQIGADAETCGTTPMCLAHALTAILTHRVENGLPIARQSRSGFPCNTMRYLDNRASGESQKWFPLLDPML
jgi:hypothetical protein